MFALSRDSITCPYCQGRHEFSNKEQVLLLIKNFTLLSLTEQRLQFTRNPVNLIDRHEEVKRADKDLMKSKTFDNTVDD